MEYCVESRTTVGLCPLTINCELLILDLHFRNDFNKQTAVSSFSHHGQEDHCSHALCLTSLGQNADWRRSGLDVVNLFKGGWSKKPWMMENDKEYDKM